MSCQDRQWTYDLVNNRVYSLLTSRILLASGFKASKRSLPDRVCRTMTQGQLGDATLTLLLHSQTCKNSTSISSIRLHYNLSAWLLEGI